VAVRSLVISVDIDQAKHSHNCQANERHRISMGDPRLKVRKLRGWDHYCMPCAKIIVERDLAKLQQLALSLQAT
jgi:hypothetical protein